MDTLDRAAYLEKKDPVKYAGTKKAMADLIKAIRMQYPDLYLISNNGYQILSEIAPYVSAIGVESVFSRHNQSKTAFERTLPARTKEKISILKRATFFHRRQIFNIEYADPGDRGVVRNCILESKKYDFKPYVAGLSFDQIYQQ